MLKTLFQNEEVKREDRKGKKKEESSDEEVMKF